MFLDKKEIKLNQRFDIAEFMLENYWDSYVEFELERYENEIPTDYKKASRNEMDNFEGFIEWAMNNSIFGDFKSG